MGDGAGRSRRYARCALWSGFAWLWMAVFSTSLSEASTPPIVPTTLDELVERQLAAHPDVVRARLRLRERVLEREAAEARFSTVVTGDVQAARSQTPTRQGITSGIVQSDRLSFESALERTFDIGLQARVAWSQSLVRSEFPVRFDDFQTTIVNGPDHESALTLTLRQSLLRGRGRTVQRAAIVQAMLREDTEVADAWRAAAERLGDLHTAWEELLAAREEVRERERSVIRAERLVELTERQVEAGRLAAVERDVALQQLLLAQEASLVARQAWEQASRRVLERVADRPIQGRTLLDPGAASDDAPALPPQEVACQRVREASLELQVLDARIQEARSAARAARDPLRPTLEATATWSQRGIEDSAFGAVAELFQLQGNTMAAGLVFAWIPGNVAARREEERARLGVELLEHERATLTDTLCRQIDTLYVEMAHLDERMDMANARVELAERALQAEERRLAGGVSTVQVTLDLGGRVDDAALGRLRLAQQRRLLALQVTRLTGELAERWVMAWETP